MTSTASRRAVLGMATLVCAAASWSSPVQAEQAVLAEVSRDAEGRASDVAAAEAATVAHFAREAASVRLTRASTLPARIPASLRACVSPSCAGELASAAEADYTVLVHVFAGDGSASAGSVSTAVVGRDGVAYAGASAFGATTGVADAAQATERALAIARERQQRGPGPWLRVRAPLGSRVSIDGGALRAVPYLERHEPGLHRVDIRDEHGAPLHEALITLGDDPASYEEVEARPAAGAPLAPPPAEHARGYFARPRSAWNYYVGVPLTVLGIAAVATGASHYLRRGDCADHACSEAYTVNGLSRGLLAGGTALTALGGIGFVALGVIREPERAPSGAMLHVEGRF